MLHQDRMGADWARIFQSIHWLFEQELLIPFAKIVSLLLAKIPELPYLHHLGMPLLIVIIGIRGWSGIVFNLAGRLDCCHILISRIALDVFGILPLVIGVPIASAEMRIRIHADAELTGRDTLEIEPLALNLALAL